MAKYIFTEKVDRDALQYILDNKETYDIGRAFVGGKLITDFKSVFTLYNNYLKSLSRDGKVEIEYIRRGLSPRLYSVSVGLTNITRKIRHTIARENNIDIDIKNCHPIFLQKYCFQNQKSFSTQ